MLSTPSIIETTAEPAAIIRLTIPRAAMRATFGPAAAELMAGLAAQGVAPVGAIFAHHLRMAPETFDFELGVRIASPVTAAGRLAPGELPAARVARAVYGGPYEGLPAAWAEFDTWMKAQGCRQAEDLWEVYTVGPQTTPDAAGWRTELNRPLLG